jgi:hypothetical protein
MDVFCDEANSIVKAMRMATPCHSLLPFRTHTRYCGMNPQKFSVIIPNVMGATTHSSSPLT